MFSSPAQNIAPVIPPTQTADSLDRGDGFDLDLAKVLLDIKGAVRYASAVRYQRCC